MNNSYKRTKIDIMRIEFGSNFTNSMMKSSSKNFIKLEVGKPNLRIMCAMKSTISCVLGMDHLSSPRTCQRRNSHREMMWAPLDFEGSSLL